MSDTWFNLRKIPTEIGQGGRKFSAAVRKKKKILYFSGDIFQTQGYEFLHYYCYGDLGFPKNVLM